MFCQATEQLCAVKLSAMRQIPMRAERAPDWINWSHPVSCLCLTLLGQLYLLVSKLLRGEVLIFFLLEHPRNSWYFACICQVWEERRICFLKNTFLASGSEGPWATYLLKGRHNSMLHSLHYMPALLLGSSWSCCQTLQILQLRMWWRNTLIICKNILYSSSS